MLLLLEALQFGLLSDVAKAEDVHDNVMGIAKHICSKSRSVNAMGKSTFYRQVVKDRNSAYQYDIYIHF